MCVPRGWRRRVHAARLAVAAPAYCGMFGRHPSPIWWRRICSALRRWRTALAHTPRAARKFMVRS